MKFNPNLYPKGGRYFVDEDGVKHRAQNWDQLALKLKNYRMRAGKPVGDPMGEILAQVCARLPDYCIGDAPAPPPRPRRESKRGSSGDLTKRVLQWLAFVLHLRRQGGVPRVSQQEAARRAAICAQCPLNRQVSQVCGQCKATRRAAAEVLIGNGKFNPQLGGCKELGMDNAVAVHLELGKENRPELPGHCWRKL